MSLPSAIPSSQTCIEVTQPGGPEVLKTTSRPVPMPGAHQVLIKDFTDKVMANNYLNLYNSLIKLKP